MRQCLLARCLRRGNVCSRDAFDNDCMAGHLGENLPKTAPEGGKTIALAGFAANVKTEGNGSL